MSALIHENKARIKTEAEDSLRFPEQSYLCDWFLQSSALQGISIVILRRRKRSLPSYAKSKAILISVEEERSSSIEDFSGGRQKQHDLESKAYQNGEGPRQRGSPKPQAGSVSRQNGRASGASLPHSDREAFLEPGAVRSSEVVPLQTSISVPLCPSIVIKKSFGTLFGLICKKIISVSLTRFLRCILSTCTVSTKLRICVHRADRLGRREEPGNAGCQNEHQHSQCQAGLLPHSCADGCGTVLSLHS